VAQGMKSVVIVGAGQLGSRHLQALKGVATPLDIEVVDPSPDALRVARERYDAITTPVPHRIAFSARREKPGAVDVAIVATGSKVRRAAMEALLAGEVRAMILEKLLFANRADYAPMAQRLAAKGAPRTWVNCPMRVMPPYQAIREELGRGPVHYRVTGSQFGLVTNAIHYLDHLAHLSGCTEYTLDTSGLDSAPVESKRPGYLEVNGTLAARFADGSRCEMTCFATGTMPVVVEICNDKRRYIVRESEGKLWQSAEESKWAWQERDAPIPFQSQMTTRLVEAILATGDCGLTPFAESVPVHLALLEPLAKFLGARSAQVDYPFT